MSKLFLVIEDHPVVRRGLEQILSAAFHDVRFGEASNATAALELAARERWDLALLDLHLPGRDGLSVLEELRRRHPSLPVLVLSVYPEQAFALRCLRLGAAGYVTKDSAPEELSAAVKKVLGGGSYLTAALAENLAAIARGDLSHAPNETLSHREMQVLRLVATGRSQKQIAGELNLSEKTVATYRARIAAKLRISTNVELTRYALRHGLVD
jgi:DNA-binding NarL/FixJ family response regulator